MELFLMPISAAQLYFFVQVNKVNDLFNTQILVPLTLKNSKIKIQKNRPQLKTWLSNLSRFGCPSNIEEDSPTFKSKN